MSKASLGAAVVVFLLVVIGLLLSFSPLLGYLFYGWSFEVSALLGLSLIIWRQGGTE